jgi:hypothetical protein
MAVVVVSDIAVFVVVLVLVVVTTCEGATKATTVD